MGIQLSKFPGHPVFHAIDTTWGSDNGISFNFHLDNKAEARMYIVSLIPFIRDTKGEEYLYIFSAEAVDRHLKSIFDEITKQIFLNTDVWVHNSLALDEACNFTGIPGETHHEEVDPSSTTHNDTPTILKDTGLVLTFRSRQSAPVKNKPPYDQGTHHYIMDFPTQH
jgi:hypothetical protein